MPFEAVNVAAGDQGFHLNAGVLTRSDDERVVGRNDHLANWRTERVDRVEKLHAAERPPFDRLIFRCRKENSVVLSQGHGRHGVGVLFDGMFDFAGFQPKNDDQTITRTGDDLLVVVRQGQTKDFIVMNTKDTSRCARTRERDRVSSPVTVFQISGIQIEKSNRSVGGDGDEIFAVVRQTDGGDRRRVI